MIKVDQNHQLSIRHRRVIVAEYPKSGGSWLVSMLSTILGMPARDIYVNSPESISGFDLRKHPWYSENHDFSASGDCVVKSHERPDTNLHQEPHQVIHLVRDGRDVVTSKWFFENDFLPKNGFNGAPSLGWEESLIKTVGEWVEFVELWLLRDDVILCRYEDLLAHPVETIKALTISLGLPIVVSIPDAIELHSIEKSRIALAALCRHNTFVRSARHGDWRHYFSQNDESIFHKKGGGLLKKLGYI